MSSQSTKALVALDGSSASVFISKAGKLLGSATSTPKKAREKASKKDAAPVSARDTLVRTMLSGMSEAVIKATDDARRAGGGSIESLHILYGAPWLHSELYDVTVNNEKPAKMTDKDIIEAVEDARLKHVRALEQASKSYKLSCVAASTARLFENGYPVRNPVGGMISQIKATTFAHYMAAEDKKEIETAASKLLSKAKITHGSLISALVSQMTKPGDDIKNASVFVIAADVTEVAIIIDDRVEAIASIPMGYNSIIDELTKTLPVVDDPFAYFAHYIHGELSKKEVESVQKVLERAVGTWATKLGETIRGAGIRTLAAEVAIAPAPRVSALYGALLGHKAAVMELFTGTAPHIRTFPHTDLLTSDDSGVF
jgi:hypothetical protein